MADKKIRNDLIKRVPLSQVVPLETPFRLGIDVSNGCNFRCIFCFQSIRKKTLKEKGFRPELMKMETFEKLAGQIKEFPNSFKSLTFGGIGEPLLHPGLPQMIHMLKGLGRADKISLITNGSLLNNSLSLAMIQAGLDEIIISVEALSSKNYYKVTGYKLDFTKYVEQIAFLYENKGNCKVYLKAVDVAFDAPQSEEQFYRLFSPISDLAYVEKIVPRYQNVDYSNISHSDNYYLRHSLKAEVCSLPFYSLSVFATGNVGPCCVDYCETILLGNVKTDTLFDIWNGNKLKKLQLSHLKKECRIPVCQGCKFTQHNGRVEDIIDADADQLIRRLEKE